MKVLRFISCSRLLVAIAAGAMLLSTVGSASAALHTFTNAELTTDFEKSGNMLNSASHDREQNFDVTGTQIDINEASRTTGSAGQELFGIDGYPSFLTDGYRLQVDLLDIDWDGGTTARVGLMTSSAIPAGGPTSGDVRSMGDYFYWAYRAGSVMAGMYTSGGIEQEGGTVSIGTVYNPTTNPNGIVGGLYMERNGGAWDLGWIDKDGNDMYVQSRSTINGDAITTDGTYVGLYSDMRSASEVRILDNLSYGFVPEPTSFVLFGLGALGLACARRR